MSAQLGRAFFEIVSSMDGVRTPLQRRDYILDRLLTVPALAPEVAMYADRDAAYAAAEHASRGWLAAMTESDDEAGGESPTDGDGESVEETIDTEDDPRYERVVLALGEFLAAKKTGLSQPVASRTSLLRRFVAWLATARPQLVAAIGEDTHLIHFAVAAYK